MGSLATLLIECYSGQHQSKNKKRKKKKKEEYAAQSMQLLYLFLANKRPDSALNAAFVGGIC